MFGLEQPDGHHAEDGLCGNARLYRGGYPTVFRGPHPAGGEGERPWGRGVDGATAEMV